ncbi:DUF4258 domain-containing protein [Sinorhizobium medicae]|uniref:DUF4258 domain-containing protein n=1 Tax=Sinorhizobium medicae TaxID=110321 RepID=UPI000C7C5C62|nr:DUF4258 domain-containing protein [Sinorhizobium medicae]PLU02521.1 hypothetical protein BMJ32_12275 [Sinorhizobium medicae]PLU57134.1 hypothetical protein BMJ23_11105 [Sinorhizobium medicae]
MKQSRHIGERMNQRGIAQAMVELVLTHGRCEQDKFVLDRREVDRRLDELNRERGLLLKVRDKGGVIVVADGETLITAYNRN